MATVNILFLSSLIIAGAAFHGTFAVQFEVNNLVPTTPGGARFDRELGVPLAKQLMRKITHFIIYDILQQSNPTDRRKQDVVKLIIDQIDGPEAVAFLNMVNVSSIYLAGYPGDLKWEFTSLLHHEMTHVYQWLPGGVPVGVVEGIADYTRLKANYYPPGFAKPGQGDRWDQGYDFTARFFEYCDGLKPGFVAQLNKKMKDKYSDRYFVDLLGKMPDQLFKEYKDKYHNITHHFG